MRIISSINEIFIDNNKLPPSHERNSTDVNSSFFALVRDSRSPRFKRLEILVSSLRSGEVRWRGEDRVSAQLSKDFQGSLEGDMSLEYPLENVSSIVPPAWWPSGCGERRSRAELKAKRELAGRETRFLAAGDPDRADSAAFFRTIDARQNFRPSLSSSLYFLPSSPFLVLPFFAMEGEKAARRAYVTLHLHNAAANCQCGRQLRK